MPSSEVIENQVRYGSAESAANQIEEKSGVRNASLVDHDFDEDTFEIIVELKGEMSNGLWKLEGDVDQVEESILSVIEEKKGAKALSLRRPLDASRFIGNVSSKQEIYSGETIYLRVEIS